VTLSSWSASARVSYGHFSGAFSPSSLFRWLPTTSSVFYDQSFCITKSPRIIFTQKFVVPWERKFLIKKTFKLLMKISKKFYLYVNVTAQCSRDDIVISVSIATFQIIFLMAIAQFSSDLKYGTYHYPSWASVGLALIIVLVSVCIIPLYMIWYFCKSDGKSWTQVVEQVSVVLAYHRNFWFLKKVKLGISPTAEWGPANRREKSKWQTFRQTDAYKVGFFDQFRRKPWL